MKPETLSDKRKEIIKDISMMGNARVQEVCMALLRRIEKQDKEFIRKLKDEFNKMTISEFTMISTDEVIDKLAGEKLTK